MTTIWALRWAIWLCQLISEVKLTSWKTTTTDFCVLTRKRFRFYEAMRSGEGDAQLQLQFGFK